MISSNLKRIVSPWLAAGFCAVLSLLTICMIIYLESVNRNYVGDLFMLVVFLCFLPLCFLYVGIGMNQMRNEIMDLRNQIDKLQNN
jgi:hypothetical protein